MHLMRNMLGAVLLLTSAIASRAMAMDDPRVIDNAGMFSADAVSKANATIKQIKQDHNQDVVVETFATIPEEMKSRYDPSQREQFYDQWKAQRYSQLRVDGVYVLITKDPGYFQIGLGEQTQKRAFTLADRDRMRNVMMNAFRQKDFDGGLTSAVDMAKQTFDQNMGNDRARTAPVQTPRQNSGSPPPVVLPGSTPRSSGGGGAGSWGCVTIGLVIVGILIVLSVIRRVLGGGRARAGYGGPGSGPSGYGPGGYGYPGGGGGGGFGTGLLGGLLGGVLGGYAQDRWSHRNDSAGGVPPPMPGDTGTSEPPPFLSDPGNMHQDTGGNFGGGDFGSSGGGDFGGGGGDFGGGGGGDAGGGGDSSGGATF
jgi:uncharacterized protein